MNNRKFEIRQYEGQQVTGFTYTLSLPANIADQNFLDWFYRKKYEEFELLSVCKYIDPSDDFVVISKNPDNYEIIFETKKISIPKLNKIMDDIESDLYVLASRAAGKQKYTSQQTRV